MIYKGHKINAEIETYDRYEVNDDGSLGDYIGDGGGDTSHPMYCIWTLDKDGNEDDNIADFTDFNAALNHIEDLTAKVVK